MLIQYTCINESNLKINKSAEKNNAHSTQCYSKSYREPIYMGLKGAEGPPQAPHGVKLSPDK